MKSGSIETQVFDSFERRSVTVCVPNQQPEAVVLAADGQRLAYWGADLTDRNLPLTLVVGIHSAPTENSRLREYVDWVDSNSFQFDSDRFARHESFVLHDVVPWVENRFDHRLLPATTAVLGVSAAAEFALAMGLRHPQLFGTVLAASPGAGYRLSREEVTALPRTYLLAGEDEPFFLDNAESWADELRKRGGEVVMKRRPGIHGGSFWRREFPKMIEWAFLN